MHSDKIEEFLKKNKIAEQAGGQDKILVQHEKGKLTGRERIDLLLDEGSFVELDKLTTHHYHEYERQKKKFFVDAGGARNQEGILSLDGFADIFYHNELASGVVPQITASMGPSAGGAVYSPAMTDFVIMVDKAASMFVTGPDVVKTVLAEEVSTDELGGAMTHATKSGVSHFVAKNEYDCMDYIKNLLSYLPQNNTQEPPVIQTDDDPNRLDHNLINIIPETTLQPYDTKEIIH